MNGRSWHRQRCRDPLLTRPSAVSLQEMYKNNPPEIGFAGTMVIEGLLCTSRSDEDQLVRWRCLLSSVSFACGMLRFDGSYLRGGHGDGQLERDDRDVALIDEGEPRKEEAEPWFWEPGAAEIGRWVHRYLHLLQCSLLTHCL